MGRLSQKQVDEIEMLLTIINRPNVSSDEKEQAYKQLSKIYDEYFVELPSKSSKTKGS